MATAASSRKPADKGKLHGRTAIVTGAGTGIGQGTAVAFAKEGANQVLVGRTLETLQETGKLIEQAGGKVHYVQGSVTDSATAEKAVSEAVSVFGGLDIVVNNAHTFSANLTLIETPEADMRTHMESGFFGTYYFMQAAFPHMKEKGGSIINFGSVAGLMGWPNFAPYAASKEAIRAMSRVASREWGPHKIRVNVIVPASHSKKADEYMSDLEVAKATLASIPMGYLGDPELDIGRVAVFLASDDSRYITGRTIQVDGGM